MLTSLDVKILARKARRFCMKAKKNGWVVFLIAAFMALTVPVLLTGCEVMSDIMSFLGFGEEEFDDPEWAADIDESPSLPEWYRTPHLTVYVSNSGSNSNEGTRESPYQTIGYAAEQMSTKFKETPDWPTIKREYNTYTVAAKIAVMDDMTVSGNSISIKSDVPILLTSDSKRVALTLSNEGYLISVDYKKELALTNIVLKGRGLEIQNNKPLVHVDTYAQFYIYGNAEIRDNWNSYNGDNEANQGGGVNNASGGIIGIWDGLITGNKAVKGGGIYHHGTTYFVSGTIEGNSAEQGGGVYVYQSTFDFRADGGSKPVIQHNEAQEGGGLYIAKGGMVYAGLGDIKENTAVQGGGVYINSYYASSPRGLELVDAYGPTNIIDNVATTSGGGVYVKSGGLEFSDAFEGTVTGNRVSSNDPNAGPGVYLEKGVYYWNKSGYTPEGLFNSNDK
jgi:hypothetical protein